LIELRTDATPPEPAVAAAVGRRGRDPSQLLQLLRELQEHYGWLPPAAIGSLARELRLPLARVRGVASFYSFLSMEPAGRYRVLFSDNVTDRMQGSTGLMTEFCRGLCLEPGRVSEDGLISVDTTSCTGL